MANSLLPTQIGFLPRNIQAGNQQYSTLVLGLNVTGAFQAVGFGANGQPDILQKVVINVSDKLNETPLTTTDIVVQIDVADLYSVIYDGFGAPNPNAPTYFEIKAREVAVCEVDETTGESVEKRMVVLASQTYLPSS